MAIDLDDDDAALIRDRPRPRKERFDAPECSCGERVAVWERIMRPVVFGELDSEVSAETRAAGVRRIGGDALPDLLCDLCFEAGVLPSERLHWRRLDTA